MTVDCGTEGDFTDRKLYHTLKNISRSVIGHKKGYLSIPKSLFFFMVVLLKQ